MNYSAVLLILTCIVYIATSQTADTKLSPYLKNVQELDTICKVWVYFSDKKSTPEKNMISPRGLARRAVSGFQMDISDCPVNSAYISEINKLGGVVQNIYKWENAVSFKIHASKIELVIKLPYVIKVSPVIIFKKNENAGNGLKKIIQSDVDYDKIHQQHLDMLHISQAQYYLRNHEDANSPGEGVFVGFFDSGFRLDHKCFSLLKSENKIKASRDFVDADNDPQDSDSSLNHGSIVLSQTVGYDPGTFIGAAWGIDIALARTEISERETHTEEDNWVAALVWAESLGVDIVSSSLGYVNTFGDSVFINGQYITDYPYSYLDGNSTIISHAAKLAVQRGLLIVNAIGNEGSDKSGTLTAPSDVDGVIAVGSVNLDTTISENSSTGPTADGRIKPDCVAPGHRVVAPGFSSIQNSYSLYYGGTSFSAPLVTGIVAMIIQKVGKPYTADDIRSRLYKYCTLIPNQDTIDNRAGRGIPDALMSVMDSSDIFIETLDSSGMPLVNVSVRSSTGELLGHTDDLGMIILGNTALNTELSVSVPGDTLNVSFQKTPAFRQIVLNSSVRLDVHVCDVDAMPISNCTVSFKIENDGSVISRTTDVSGNAILLYGTESPVKIYVSSPNYFSPDSVESYMTSSGQVLTVTLTKIPSNAFVVYPNVIKRDERQAIKALFSYAVKGYKPATILAFICSVDGSVVWKENKLSQPGTPTLFVWNGKSGKKPVATGIYYFVVQFNKETYRKKFLIAG